MAKKAFRTLKAEHNRALQDLVKNDPVFAKEYKANPEAALEKAVAEGKIGTAPVRPEKAGKKPPQDPAIETRQFVPKVPDQFKPKLSALLLNNPDYLTDIAEKNNLKVEEDGTKIILKGTAQKVGSVLSKLTSDFNGIQIINFALTGGFKATPKHINEIFAEATGNLQRISAETRVVINKTNTHIEITGKKTAIDAAKGILDEELLKSTEQYFDVEKGLGDQLKFAILCGPDDKNIKQIAKSFKVRIERTDTGLGVFGSLDNVKNAMFFINMVMPEIDIPEGIDEYDLYASGIEGRTLAEFCETTQFDLEAHLKNSDLDIKKYLESATFTSLAELQINGAGVIKPRNIAQKQFIEQIGKYDLTFGLGDAGTGKTYIAVAMGIQALRNKEVEKIIISRPLLEAGEQMGFLPGDMHDKTDPMLQPIYQNIDKILNNGHANDPEKRKDKLYEAMVKNGQLIISPLAFARGQSFDNAFVILDEAQNTTREQMTMFVTRLGYKSKMVVVGDITQSDLPKQNSGLKWVMEQVLAGKNFFGKVEFDSKYIVRHPAVKLFVEAVRESKNPKAAFGKGSPVAIAPRELDHFETNGNSNGHAEIFDGESPLLISEGIDETPLAVVRSAARETELNEIVSPAVA